MFLRIVQFSEEIGVFFQSVWAKLFRCDSISQHLPLSVSGSVSQSFIVSDWRLLSHLRALRACLIQSVPDLHVYQSRNILLAVWFLEYGTWQILIFEECAKIWRVIIWKWYPSLGVPLSTYSCLFYIQILCSMITNFRISQSIFPYLIFHHQFLQNQFSDNSLE